MQLLAHSLSGLGPAVLAALVERLRPGIVRRRGRPWALTLERRILIACASLRTNLTVRELATVFGISPTQAHRIVTDIVRRLAALVIAAPSDLDRRHTWVVDVPTRDHRVAAKAKIYRWACNAQVLIRRRDLRVIAVATGGPGNRNDPVHYRGTEIEQLCRLHGRVLADTAACPSSSPPSFVDAASCEIGRGATIVGAELVSNMRSRASRTGASCGTIDAEVRGLSSRFERLLSCTISRRNYETPLSLAPAGRCVFRTVADRSRVKLFVRAIVR